MACLVRAEVRAGDASGRHPGHRHGLGATAMTHIAVPDALDGKNINWNEKEGKPCRTLS